MAKLTLPSPGQLVSELVHEAVDFAQETRKSGEIQAGDFDFIERQERKFFDALVSELPDPKQALPHSVYAIVDSLLHHEHNVPGVISDFLLQ